MAGTGVLLPPRATLGIARPHYRSPVGLGLALVVVAPVDPSVSMLSRLLAAEQLEGLGFGLSPPLHLSNGHDVAPSYNCLPIYHRLPVVVDSALVVTPVVSSKSAVPRFVHLEHAEGLGRDQRPLLGAVVVVSAYASFPPREPFYPVFH